MASKYEEHLYRALKRLQRFRPGFLVLALGLDISRADPTGSWDLVAKDFEVIGEKIGSLGIPTLITQEGGYNNRVLGINARSFFTGLWKGAYSI